ncbi:MAG: flagellar hook-length control protein FliK [Gammaproteobacteria bacterium]|nr:flagellar hook-length control protein FliK [Gammaproteobacteria bacterium]
MNQAVLINTNTVQASVPAAAHAAIQSDSHQDKTQAGEAFSSELDKHVEKTNATSSKVDSDGKKSDKDTTSNTKSQDSVDKDGNNLPEDNTVAEQLGNDDEFVAEGFELAESDMSAVGDNTVKNRPDQDDIEQGLIQTEAVDDIRPMVMEQKQVTEQTQHKSAIGKLVSDNVKNMTKPNQDGSIAAQSALVEEVAQTKVATTQSALEKENAPKLRPDILQALSLRSADGKGSALPAGEKAKTEAIIDKNVASLKAHNSQLQIPEFISKAATNQSNASSDKSLLGVFSTPLNQTALSGQAKTDGPVLDIQPSLQSAAWNRVMTSRVLWMAREGVQHASLKLNPANLGPVEVRLNMHHDQANVTFIAQSAVTRDALEQALPRLRESFAQNGLELTNADVSQQSFGQSGDNNQDEAGLNSGTMQHNLLQTSDDDSEQQQKIVDNDSEIELGLSIYA